MDPNILTQLSLNILKTIGGQNSSFVFSPVSILLSLASQNLTEKYIPGISNIQGTVQKFSAQKTDSYTIDWQYQLNEFRVRKMSNSLKNLKFLKMNIKDNLLLSCDDLLARYTINEDLEVLELPLSEEPEKFVAFIPRNNGNLSDLIENLTTSKFQDLLYKLSPEFVDFEIPTFKIKSNLQYPVPNSFQFEIPDKTEEEVQRDPGFIKRPCETIPINLYLNRPFLFSVIVDKDPILMGVFNDF